MDYLNQLVHELSKLPGIGPKSATRLTYHLLNTNKESIERLSHTLIAAKENTRLCDECHTYTQTQLCSICEKTNRSKHQIIVVERPCDADAIENTHHFLGTYHVLHGLLSPMDGIGPQQLKCKELIQRISKLEQTQEIEIILAINPSIEGEATCLYIKQILNSPIKITRIAYGLPMGGALEYADQMTITKALDNRVQYK